MAVRASLIFHHIPHRVVIGCRAFDVFDFLDGFFELLAIFREIGQP